MSGRGWGGYYLAKWTVDAMSEAVAMLMMEEMGGGGLEWAGRVVRRRGKVITRGW